MKNEKFKKQKRNNETELRKEIQRVYDKLQTKDPGTKEYKDTIDCYGILLDKEKELKRIKKDVEKEIEKCVAAGTMGIAGIILYRVMLDHTGDPFFRDIGKGFIKLVHV